jgi:hypothetical protein
MVEYFLRYRLSDSMGKAGIALSRIWASTVLVMKSRTYRFTIGRDQERNAAVLSEFLLQYPSQSGIVPGKKVDRVV